MPIGRRLPTCPTCFQQHRPSFLESFGAAGKGPNEIVDGLYRLCALINRSIRSTVYKTEFGEDGLGAVIKIREYESSGSEELVERWRNAMELAHPNLLKIYATGPYRCSNSQRNECAT